MYRLSESNPRVRTAAPRAHGVLFAGESRRVLVADDNRDWAEGLAVLLAGEGYSVRTAYDGRQALEAAREFQPHIVVLDLRMPNMTGYEAAKVFSRHPLATRPLLIGVSAWADESARLQAERSGFAHFLAKPADTAEIVELLRGA